MSSRTVAIGGGTGLPRVLTSLSEAGFDMTAIVTVADDGGSSGLLRRDLGVLPPGDARNCLVALGDPDTPLARVFQYRFPRGEGLAGHALGNLVIAALADLEGGFPEALETAGRMLGTSGRVLPSTTADVVLVAELCEGGHIEGQAAAANSEGPLRRVRLEPASPPAYPPALDAIYSADVVVVGPGSLFTSLLPNFLVAGVADALRDSRATRVYVCNVANQRGETSGMDAADHVAALDDHGLAGCFDVVLAHDTNGHPLGDGVEAVVCDDRCAAAIGERGLRLVTTDLADASDTRHHDPAKLRAALEQVI